MPIYTIGHSSHTIDEFFRLLALFGITHLIDIRSVPYSGRFFHFRKDFLRGECESRGIIYVWRGGDLGSPRVVRGDEIQAVRRYGDIGKATEQLVRDFFDDTSDSVPCLMCAERDPLQCHRTTMIGPELLARDIDLHHILVDGTIVLQSELAEKITRLKKDRSGTMGLFDN